MNFRKVFFLEFIQGIAAKNTNIFLSKITIHPLNTLKKTFAALHYDQKVRKRRKKYILAQRGFEPGATRVSTGALDH